MLAKRKDLAEPSIMQRRTFLTTGLAATALPHRFAIAQSARARTLRFVPQANLTLLDPIFTTALVTVTPTPTPTPSSSVARTRLLNYLNQISGNHSLSGNTSRSSFEEFNADKKALGFPVAIACCDFWLTQGGFNDYDNSFQNSMMNHSKAGGIISIEACYPHPGTFGSCTDGTPIDANQLLQTGTTLNNNLRRILDRTASGLQPYKAAGKAVIWRSLMEMAGNWFWWGVQNFSASQYIRLYRFIYDYLVITKGLDNLLYAWSSNIELVPDVTNRYVGDNYVDIIGWSSYNNDPAGQSRPIYNYFRSTSPTKLIALAEFGSGTPSSPDTNFDAEKFTNQLKNQLTRICYTNAWSGWGYRTMRNARRALQDPYIINRAQVNIP